jgi:hypothetical protein
MIGVFISSVNLLSLSLARDLQDSTRREEMQTIPGGSINSFCTQGRHPLGTLIGTSEV